MTHDDSNLPDGTTPDAHDGLERFDAALGRWADRPPDTPAAEAARRITARIAEREASRGAVRAGRAPWRPLLAGAAAAAALAVAALLGSGRIGPAAGGLNGGGPNGGGPNGGGHDAIAAAAVPAPAGDGVLILWLDERTPLYMTLDPPAADTATEVDDERNLR